jgi:hypothetical protein
MEGVREGAHLHAENCSHLFLKSRTRNLTGWYSGNIVGLYLGDAWFKSEPGHWVVLTGFYGFLQSLQADAGIVF